MPESLDNRLDIEQMFGTVSNARSVHPNVIQQTHEAGSGQEEDMQTTRNQLSVQLSVILATICAVFLLIGGDAEAEEPVYTVEYVVAQGDTLWEVASDYVPADADVRPFIRAIKDASGLTSSSLHPGQVLHIPSP